MSDGAKGSLPRTPTLGAGTGGVHVSCTTNTWGFMTRGTDLYLSPTHEI